MSEPAGVETPSLFPDLPVPDVPGRAERAWEAYEASADEPPWDENHYRYHTPAKPLETCATCLYQGWAEDEDRERRIFLAGYAAGAEES
jgi:hypothetical protein